MNRVVHTFAAVVAIAAVLGGAAFKSAALSQSLPQSRRGPAESISRRTIPHEVSLREVRGRGLLVQTWVNGAGPFNFAVDTGAGTTIISPRVAGAAHVGVSTRRGPTLAGLSGASVSANEGRIQSLAIGDAQNILPARPDVIVGGNLPADLDGLLDPNEAFSSLGYILDIPARQLSAFDPREQPLVAGREPPGGAVVPWVQEAGSHRPFVTLDTGERALLDTGSSLGFAVHEGGRIDRERSMPVRPTL